LCLNTFKICRYPHSLTTVLEAKTLDACTFGAPTLMYIYRWLLLYALSLTAISHARGFYFGFRKSINILSVAAVEATLHACWVARAVSLTTVTWFRAVTRNQSHGTICWCVDTASLCFFTEQVKRTNCILAYCARRVWSQRECCLVCFVRWLTVSGCLINSYLACLLTQLLPLIFNTISLVCVERYTRH
jgi:hypothetical protein